MMSVQGITGKLQLANTPFQPTQLCFSLTALSCATFNGEIMGIKQSQRCLSIRATSRLKLNSWYGLERCQIRG